MRALDRKLLRDLWHAKGQAMAIAMVVAGGTATYILSATTLDSLQRTQAHLYAEYLFADVFVNLKRAPESVRGRMEEIPGVQVVETRIAVPATVDLPAFEDPITAQVLSLPDGRQPVLNRLYLESGRLPEPGREQEAVVSDGFAEAHGLQPGARLDATIYGRRRTLELVGVASSPEFIYQLQPGAIVPDFKTYAILWMNQEPVEAAFNMTGAFNQASLRLDRSAVEGDVIDRLDDVLKRYGSLGAHGRMDQVSHRYLSEEFRSLGIMATMFPVIFLSVAAFLLNVVMTRLMATQRGQIAILKAFGYTTAAIVWHYLKMAAAIVAIGTALGVAGGMWMGSGLSNMYMEFYRFPYIDFMLRPRVAITAAMISMAAAAVGTIVAVVKAAAEPPAQAMQPASPGLYRRTLLERLGAARLSQPTRMILRNLERRPLKALFSAVGVAMSGAVLVMGGFWGDSVDFMGNFQFQRAQRDDLTVNFAEAVSESAAYSLVSLPGVTAAEPFRSAAARFRFEQRSYRAGIQGMDNGGVLRRLLDRDGNVVELPPEGIVLTDYLAGTLGVEVGELLTVEVLEGRRGTYQVPVTGLVKEYVGLAAYMRRDALNRMLREGDSISGAYLAADMQYAETIFDRLKEMPLVAGTTVRASMIRNFYEILARQMLTFAFFNTILAATIAIGVVYNTVRISFSERSHELASLRVLGYTRGEISYILLGELAIILLVAIPVGMWVGKWLALGFASAMQTDIFRIPLVIDQSTYAFSALVVLLAAVISGALVRRKLDKLNLVEALKIRE